MKPKIIYLFILVTVFSTLSFAGQDHMTIKMSEAVPPAFSFHAGPLTHFRHLSFFIVIELAPGNEKIPAYEQPRGENRTLWWIFPGDSEGSKVENVPTITYGKLPPGWTQKTPEHGEPPALVEGKFYEAGGPQIEVPWACMRFTIRNGKAVRVPLYRNEFENQGEGH